MNTQISKIISSGVVVAILLYTTSCANDSQFNPTWDPAPVPDTTYCGAACDHIGQNDGGLNCQEGQPIELAPDACVPDAETTDCITCKRFCEDTQTQGVWLNPKCVASIESCSQIDTCQEVKR